MKFKWPETKQKMFEEIKEIVYRTNRITYPDFDTQFEIHTNDSAFHPGEYIIHKKKVAPLP